MDDPRDNNTVKFDNSMDPVLFRDFKKIPEKVSCYPTKDKNATVNHIKLEYYHPIGKHAVGVNSNKKEMTPSAYIENFGPLVGMEITYDKTFTLHEEFTCEYTKQ